MCFQDPLVNAMNQQGLLGDKKREGRCSVVHLGKRLYESKRICGRLLDRNVANKMDFEYLYRVIVEYRVVVERYLTSHAKLKCSTRETFGHRSKILLFISFWCREAKTSTRPNFESRNL